MGASETSTLLPSTNGDDAEKGDDGSTEMPLCQNRLVRGDEGQVLDVGVADCGGFSYDLQETVGPAADGPTSWEAPLRRNFVRLSLWLKLTPQGKGAPVLVFYEIARHPRR